MDPEEFRRSAHQLVDWIADYRIRAGELEVRSPASPGSVKACLPPAAPASKEPFDALLSDLDTVVVPGLTHTQHPRNFAWFPSNASLSSVLGDIAAAGLGALGITWQSAPALTEIEEVVCDWMRQLTGLSSSWHGTITDGASSAVLVACLTAREVATGYGLRSGGLQAAQRPLTAYFSTDAHSSVRKAALLAGFGEDNLRPVPVRPWSREMDGMALEALMAADVAEGRQPAIVIATAGTTGTTAFDPIDQIIPLARRHGARIHVDAAMAGAAMMLQEMRPLFSGIDDADTITWNPHKWMGSVLETSLFYVKDPSAIVKVMATDPSYLRSEADGSVVQYRDWGIPLGRRFRALKLWFQLRLDGPDAICSRLRRDLENARRLSELVTAGEAFRKGWRLVAPVQLQTVCVRHEPENMGREALDLHTLRWCEAVNATGRAHLTPAVVDRAWMVRVSIGAEPTTWQDVEAAWSLMVEQAEAAAR